MVIEKHIDRMIKYGELFWNNNKLGQEATIYYSFSDMSLEQLPEYAVSWGNAWPGANSFATPQDLHKKYILDALNSWSQVANIKFIEDSKQAKLIFTMVDYSYSSSWGEFKASKFHNPQMGAIFLNKNFFSLDKLQDEDLILKFSRIVLHEIGHSLGLKHLFETVQESQEQGEEKYHLSHYTVMAYPTMLFNGHPTFPQTPMDLDIAIVKKIYGPNPDKQHGDNQYKISYDIKGVRTLYDPGGYNVFDSSAIKNDQQINLNWGFEIEFPSIIHQNLIYYFATDTQIHKLITGPGNDVIHGRLGSDKIIDPGSGNNVLKGNGGKTTYIFKDNYVGNNQILDFVYGQDKIILQGHNQQKNIIKHNNDIQINFSSCIIKLIGCHNCFKDSDVEFQEA